MGSIKKLDKFVSNRIAAGEVVDRPASVVKELVENSIDAGATNIRVDVFSGGLASIMVKDNGNGIEPEDCVMAFERHATSKIANASDLDSIHTLGFRGEALSSIAAVSQVELNTRVPGAESGTCIKIAGGTLDSCKPSGCDYGTTIRVDNLFFNTPARKKFMRKPSRETADVTKYIADLIMARPDISIEYNSDGKQVYKSPGRGELLYALFTVYGRDVVTKVEKIDKTTDGIHVFGYVSYSEAARPNRSSQSFFVNNRCVQSKQLSAVVQSAYGTRLMIGRFPLCSLHIVVPPDTVDVNIHPSKLEVRFDDNNKVFEAVRLAVEKGIDDRYAIRINHSQPREVSSEGMVKERFERAYSDISNVKLDVENGVSRQSEFTKFIREPRPIMPPNEDKKTEAASVPINDKELREISAFSYEHQESPALMKQSSFMQALFSRINETGEKINDTRVEVTSFGDDVSDYNIVGQVFSTYVIAQKGEELYFVDQHAAHERILYDKLLNKETKIASQVLLSPLFMTLTGLEFSCLNENKARLNEFGYDYKVVTGTRIKLTAIPADMNGCDPAASLRGILDAIDDCKDIKDPHRRDLEIATIACKQAIKGNEVLTDDQIKMLLRQLDDTDELHCPHGRPIVVCFTKRDLDKMFRRII